MIKRIKGIYYTVKWYLFPKTKPYNPYCEVCTGCGEEGCCSPLACEMSPKGQVLVIVVIINY